MVTRLLAFSRRTGDRGALYDFDASTREISECNQAQICVEFGEQKVDEMRQILSRLSELGEFAIGYGAFHHACREFARKIREISGADGRGTGT